MNAHLVNVEITNLVYGGNAMGRLDDGRAVFVPFALPGELVEVQILQEKRGHVMGKLTNVLRASPDRISPRCRHFQQCGGCHYQMMDYPLQLKTKQNILIEQLERIGGIKNPPVSPVVPSAKAWNYRNHIQFHLDPQGKPGYLASGSDQVVPIQECFLPEDLLNEIWPQLDMDAVPGLQRVSLRLGLDNDVQVILESSKPLTDIDFSLDMPISAMHLGPEGPVLLAGDPNIVMQVGNHLFQVSSESFFQVNTAQAANMAQALLDCLKPQGYETVFDVYCGVGLFSAFLAPHVKRVIGIESSEMACSDFVANLDCYDNVELYVGLAEEIIPSLNIAADIVVVDPPRAGLAKPVMDTLLLKRPETIVYISCDPATLARDLRKLSEAGYQLDRVTPFDLFPQTFHIESVSILITRSSGK